MAENQQSSAAPPKAKGGSGPSGCPEENKDVVATPNLSSAAEVTATVVATTNGDGVSDKGKGVAADDEELLPHIVAERMRRTRMRDYYGELQALIPQIPAKCDKGTIVGHAIDYIQSLQKTKAKLEKRKQKLELARQAGAEAVASSSSAPAPAPAPPQSAQGMALAAMSSSDVPDACSAVGPQPLPPLQPVPVPDLPQPPLAAAAEPAPPPEHRITAVPVGFQTWSWPDLLLSVSNNNAYINVCSPRRRGMWTMVMVLSVLNKYGIDVVTAQVDSDALRSVFNIYARVNAMVGGNNSSALEVYQLAVSEILVWLTTS